MQNRDALIINIASLRTLIINWTIFNMLILIKAIGMLVGLSFIIGRVI